MFSVNQVQVLECSREKELMLSVAHTGWKHLHFGYTTWLGISKLTLLFKF